MNGEKSLRLPLVSVIIPVYNVESYLPAAMDSVLKQDYVFTEIILVDDGSTDESGKICDEYAKKTNIKVVHKQNGGLSSARNVGLENISKESSYVLFFDSDDVLVDDAISGMVGMAEENFSDIVIPDRYYSFIDGNEELRLCYHFKNMYYEQPKEFLWNVLIDNGRAWRAHSLLYRTSLLRESNACFDERIKKGEDFTFNMSVLNKAKKISFYKKPTVKYRRRKHSLSQSFDITYADSIHLMDKEIERTFENSENYAENVKKKISLLQRNVVLYITTIMSPENGMTRQDKINFAMKILEDQRFEKIYTIKNHIPYFEKKIASIYFRIMYFLMYRKKKKLMIYVADIANLLV